MALRFCLEDGFLCPELLSKTKGETAFFRIDDLREIPVRERDASFPFDRSLQLHLAGKKLLLEEIPFPLALVHSHAERGYIAYGKGVERRSGGYFCHRCHNENPRLFHVFPCARCRRECAYCRRCLMTGRISQCTPLLEWRGPEPAVPCRVQSAWQGELQPAQREAAGRIVRAIEKREALIVWAVCGAGKTEMLFPGIGRALKEGMRVAIATPRTDVVFELVPRLKRAFPTVPVAALYGGSQERFRFAPLSVSTTHQLLRFYKAFDVLIIDEVDAFPFSCDEMLQTAANRAKKDTGAQIFLTATPSEKWKRECLRGLRNCVILPARFHRRPLPVPRFVWCGNWRKAIRKGQLPAKVADWVRERVRRGKRCLVFFPDVERMEQALPLFLSFCPGALSVHANDPQRKEKVEKMRKKEVLVLLTTTILERGVTFPDIDVAVVGAEDDIFTESALVQISGRVGRHPDYPDGDVVFFHYGKTRAMIEAKKHIMWMNREAEKRKLLSRY
ncbi:DEAD/DEAH box helicase [Caldibacillus debilis]|nr:DEAD/DEAH box helicase [Caldibacillus debilis]